MEIQFHLSQLMYHGICMMVHVTWLSLLELISWYLFMYSSLCNSFEDQAPLDEIYGQCSDELQWLDLTIIKYCINYAGLTHCHMCDAMIACWGLSLQQTGGCKVRMEPTNLRIFSFANLIPLKSYLLQFSVWCNIKCTCRDGIASMICIQFYNHQFVIVWMNAKPYFCQVTSKSH